MERLISISNPNTGEQKTVTPAEYARVWNILGWIIVGFAK